MKKVYQTPETNVFKMVAEPVMGVTSTSEIQASQNASNYSRGASDWDDEE